MRDAVSSMFKLLDDVDDEHQITGHILSNKTPRELNRFFDVWNAEIVILGTNGKGQSPLIGSFAQRLLSRTDISAISIKSTSRSKLNKVLFASDFSENDILIKAFDKLKAYSRAFQFEIEAVRINTPINFLSTDKINALFDSFAGKCEFDRQRLHSYNAFTVEEGVCSFAEMIDGDAIAVFSLGHRGIKKLFHHSFSNQIIQYSDIPVLTIKQ
jgi:nucleotide-binding universal stress UspA family protein